MNFFATAVQGLGQILQQEIERRLEGASIGRTEFDGRNDIVGFACPTFDPYRLRVSEDVYVLVAHASGRHPNQILLKVLEADAFERALSVFASTIRPLRARMSYRVVTRVLTEEKFLRSELRDRATDAVAGIRPKWYVSDPAELELWLVEASPGQYRLGLRLTRSDMRHRGGRTAERAGALKPTVAGAMVLIAGESRDRPLLDPACGSGTIIAEAVAAGWAAAGSDVDPSAVSAAQQNLGRASVLVADARRLPFATETFGVVASNLPFGDRYRVSGSPADWLAATLGEAVRVTGPGAPIVILVPQSRPLDEAMRREGLSVEKRYNIRLRGHATALWKLVGR